MIDTIVIIKNKKSVMNANRYRYSSFPDTKVMSRKHKNIRTSNNPLWSEQHIDTAFLFFEKLHTSARPVYKSIVKAIRYFDNSIT